MTRIIDAGLKAQFAVVREKLEQRGHLEVNSYITAKYILRFPNKYSAELQAYCQGIIDFIGDQPGTIPGDDPDTL